MTIPRDIKKTASDFASKWYFPGWEYERLRDEVAALLAAERGRVIGIIAAEQEWGGDVAEMERRIERGELPRQIEGFNSP